MIKTNGAEFKKFYNDPLVWVNECYHDDVAFKINGKTPPFSLDMAEDIKDTDIIEFEGGFIVTGEEVTQDFGETFLVWQKAQTAVIVAVHIPKDKIADLQAFLKNISGEIL
jgi:hypothetical protein